MWSELKNVARREARNWLIAAIVAVAYAAMAGSCTPQPAAHRQLVGGSGTAGSQRAAGRERGRRSGSSVRAHERSRADARDCV